LVGGGGGAAAAAHSSSLNKEMSLSVCYTRIHVGHDYVSP